MAPRQPAHATHCATPVGFRARCARVLQSGYKPARTIEFTAQAAEEAGLRGSAAIASEYSTQGRKVVGVLQLDMTHCKAARVTSA